MTTIAHMEPWLIAVIVIASLVGAYLVFFIFRLIHVLHFRKSIYRRLGALTVIIEEEKDMLTPIYVRLRKEGEINEEEPFFVELDQHSLIGSHNESRIKKMQEEGHLLASKLKKHATSDENTVFYFLEDLEKNYQRIAAQYNRDLIGYEYWRKHPLYRFLFVFFGFRQRQRLI